MVSLTAQKSPRLYDVTQMLEHWLGDRQVGFQNLMSFLNDLEQVMTPL